MDACKPLEFLGKPIGLILLILLFNVPLLAQTEPATADAPSSFEADLAATWRLYQKAKNEGNEDERERIFRKIEEVGRQNRGDIFELGAYLFLLEGRQDLDRGDLDQARTEFLHARDLNPHLWPAYEGLARVKRAESGLVRYFRLSVNGMVHAFQVNNAWFYLDLLAWLFDVLTMGTMGFLIIFAFVLCLKYARPFYASTMNAFEEKSMNELYARLLAVAILALPLLLGLNLYLIAGAYLVIFFPHFEDRERQAALLAFATALVLSLLAYLNDNVDRARVDRSLRAQMSQFTVGDVDTRLAMIEQNPGAEEYRDMSTLVQGLLEKADGDLRKALTTFEKVSSSSPWAGHAQVNKGNILFWAREYQEALEIYQSAAKKEDIKPLALFNQSVVQDRQGFHDRAESLRQQSFKLDSRLAERAARTGPGRVLDALPNTDERLVDAVLAPGSEGMENASSRIFPPIGLAIGLVLMSFIHLRFRNPRLLARSCEKCGRVYFHSDAPESDWCSQCVALYIKKDDLPSEAKLRKADEVLQYNKRKRRFRNIGQLLLPGTKKLVGGNAVSGTITLGIWLVLVTFCIFPMTGMSHIAMRQMDSPVLPTLIIGAITLVYWLIFGLRPALQED